MKKKRLTQVLSLFLTAVILNGVFPSYIFAADEDITSNDEAILEKQAAPQEDPVIEVPPQAPEVQEKMVFEAPDNMGAGETRSTGRVPTAPGNLKATSKDKAVLLTWTAPASTDPIIRYEVSLDNWRWTPIDTTSYEYTGLTNGRQYTFYVRAVTKYEYGNAASVTATPSASALPGQPTNVTTTAKDSEILLNWDPPASDGGSPITGYQVKISDASDTWINVNKNTYSYAFSQLENGREYTLSVRSINSVGFGEAVDVTATSSTTPALVENLTTEEKSKSITLNWEAPISDGGSSITQYEVRYRLAYGTWSSWSSTNMTTTYTYNDLSNNRTYNFEVRAVNSNGSGLARSISGTPFSIPGIPKNLKATPSNKAVALTWDKPDSDNSISKYQVSLDGINWRDVYFTSYTYTNLTNGVPYTFYVRACTPYYVGAATTIVATPATKPGQPTDVDTIIGNKELTLIWNAPLSDGGAPITGYQVKISGSGNNWIDVDENTYAYTFGQLKNGTSYTISVRALNSQGYGYTSSVTAMPATSPDKVQNLTVEENNKSITLNWNAPASNGGSKITDYQVRFKSLFGADPWSDWQGTGKATTHTYTNLTNNTLYIFEVQAVNTIGASESSAIQGKPFTLPGIPKNLQGISSNKTVALTWDNSDSEDLVFYYQVSSDGRNWKTVYGNEYTYTNLDNGTAYTFHVRACTFYHTSEAAKIIATPATVPSPPTEVTPYIWAKTVILEWEKPLSDGGAPITGYQVKISTAPYDWIDVDENTFDYVFSKLQNGTDYILSVRAVNSQGYSEAVDVVANPATKPSIIRNLTIEENSESITVNWEAPRDNGGRPISDYQICYYSEKDQTWSAWLSTDNNTTYTYDNLSNNSRYLVLVGAVNELGRGEFDLLWATPHMIPEAPTNFEALPGNQIVDLTWEAPDVDTPIIRYEVSLDGEEWTEVSTESYQYTGLENGTLYTFYVRAVTKYATGIPASVESIPARTPDEPQNLVATAGDGQVTLTWEEPLYDGGSEVTEYQVAINDEEWITVDDLQYTFMDLENGTDYTFSVRAVNECGGGIAVDVTVAPVDPFSYRVLVHEPTGISAAGYFTDDAVLSVASTITHASGTCAVCSDLSSKLNANELHALYNIAASGQYRGTLEITIPVSGVNNGSSLKLIHCANSIREERDFTVANGAISGVFDSFSPFAILKQESKDEQSKKPTTIQVDKKQADKKKALPKTGSTPYLLVSTLLLTAGLATLIYRKKQK